MESIRIVTFAALIVGGLNWGLVGLFSLDVVAALFGPASAPARIIYVLAGACALAQATLQAWRPDAARVEP